MHGRREGHFEHRREEFRPGFFGPRMVVEPIGMAPAVVIEQPIAPIVIESPFIQPPVVVVEPMIPMHHRRW